MRTCATPAAITALNGIFAHARDTDRIIVSDVPPASGRENQVRGRF